MGKVLLILPEARNVAVAWLLLFSRLEIKQRYIYCPLQLQAVRGYAGTRVRGYASTRVPWVLPGNTRELMGAGAGGTRVTGYSG